MIQWQPEMKGSLPRVALSTTVASGQTFAPSARRGVVDDQRRDADRRVFCQSLHSVPDPAVGVGSMIVPTISMRKETVSRELAGTHAGELTGGQVLFIGCDDDGFGINRCGGDQHVAAVSFCQKLHLFVCHFGPPVGLLI